MSQRPGRQSDLNGPTYSAKRSGDGYELVDHDGTVFAWTLDRQWAWQIIVALEAEQFHQHTARSTLPL